MKEKMILAMQEHTEHNKIQIPSLTMQEGTEIRAEDLTDEMWLAWFAQLQRGDAWSFFAWFDAARRKDE